MGRFLGTAVATLTLLLAPTLELHGQSSLRGSRTSLYRQNAQARSHDYSYLGSRSDVSRFIRLGLLVPVRGNGNYRLARVSFPYARPAVKTFIERLSRQYRNACGEELVVTSLTRPESHQPRNASRLSVHPTGMAMDLRRSRKASCRRWLERTLLSLERTGVLDATRERRPPHYHVALFPEPYLRYVDRLKSRAASGTRMASSESKYEVHQGDTLWGIAKRHGTTVDALKAINGLRSAKILPGQVLAVEASR